MYNTLPVSYKIHNNTDNRYQFLFKEEDIINKNINL